MMNSKRFIVPIAVVVLMAVGVNCFGADVTQQSADAVTFKLSMGGGNFGKAINILLLMTALSVIPSAMMMMTSFARIMIVLGFLRKALGTQSAPSNKILAGLSLFLTIFIMQPVWSDIYKNSIKPLTDKKITEKVAIEHAVVPLKQFMLKQTRESSLLLFMELSGIEEVDSPDSLSMSVIIPAFMVSELKTAFQMGFLIYLPFLLIDIVIATTLMAMGMMMLPPMMISLPFKILLFVVVDGWTLTVRSLVASFS